MQSVCKISTLHFCMYRFAVFWIFMVNKFFNFVAEDNMGRNYKFKCIKESFQKELFYKASDILLDRHKVGLDIFTSGGKSIISGELIYFIEEKLGRDAKVLVVTNTSVWDNLLITYTSDRVGLNKDNLYFVSNAK